MVGGGNIFAVAAPLIAIAFQAVASVAAVGTGMIKLASLYHINRVLRGGASYLIIPSKRPHRRHIGVTTTTTCRTQSIDIQNHLLVHCRAFAQYDWLGLKAGLEIFIRHTAYHHYR